ncbi:MAG: glycosyltransferase family 2 protein [Lachnospiraceae bacterium]|nr:glycosyltransferase family 2 protein [Lachnospiraceae bacterium]
MSGYKVPFVSVIIPTYNRRHILPDSISSVLNQSYRDFELIIVDDGSDDGTEEYVESIADDRVKYLKTDRKQGPAAARNLGARAAKGEYLAFHDSDDEWLPDKLDKQMALLTDEKAGVSMVYCEYSKYNGADWLIVPPREIPYECKQGDLFAYLLLQPLIGTPTIVVSREKFFLAGGFNETLQTYEDYEFTLRFAEKYRIGFVGEALVKVNQSPNSVNKRLDERIRAQFYMLEEMLDALKEKGLLWKKLELLLQEAAKLECYDVFIEELRKLLSGQFDIEAERERLEALLRETEQSDERINELQTKVREKFAGLKQQILKVYLGLYGGQEVQAETLLEIGEKIQECVSAASAYFVLSPKCLDTCHAFGEKEIPNNKTEQLFWLTEAVGLLEELEKDGLQMFVGGSIL